MWTVVYIASSHSDAAALKDCLGREGILATIRPVGLDLPDKGGNYEVLVPEAEAEEALLLVQTSPPKQ